MNPLKLLLITVSLVALSAFGSEKSVEKEPKHSKGYNETKQAHYLRNLREKSEAGQGLPPLEERLAAIKNHNRAIQVLDPWIRDPFIFIGDDGAYYLTGTTIDTEPDGVIGIPLWRSENLAEWEKLPRLWQLSDSSWMGDVRPTRHANPNLLVWAPEVYQFGEKWVMMHTTNANTANLLVSKSESLRGGFDEPMQADFGARHDPFLFVEDGKPWLVWGCTKIAPLQKDFLGFAGETVEVGPSNRSMGHEGSSIMKIGKKYVLFGTAWSTDHMRKGTYNLYYCTSDKLEGPYDERKFAGRFLGHGTPFKDKQGRWWCTAFFNANHTTSSLEETMDLNKTKGDAYTINKMGVTLVPLEIQTDKTGNISVRAKDPRYAKPGPEEVQQF
ncbi:MAG: family 43 glycosylhydrolase [Opitutales bacterium]|nr:family 43 glycosylhydrolase [Opitutales bacterium]